MSKKESAGADAELDLQAILKKAEAQTDFPDVPFDEFTPPTYEEWKENCIALLKGAPFDKKMYTKTYEGITFDPMYFRKTTEDILPRTSFPGLTDFMRGARPNGYIDLPWGIAQACDETMPAENNALLKHEVKNGSTIYNVKVDDATLLCEDVREAKHPGKKGVSLTTLADMHTLLDGLKLDKYPLYLYGGKTALPLLAMTAAAYKASGGHVEKLQGFIGADPIGELASRGTSGVALDALWDDMAACAKWAQKHAPGLRTVMVKSDVYSNGGANDVQEMAYTLATATTYLRVLMERGLTIDEAASTIMFTYSMGANFFLQIAKLRAVRPLWAQIVKAFGGSTDAQVMHIHARPALFFKTVYDPYVNMLRNTTEIFSGVVGGLDSFENATFDEPIRKGDEFSRRIARNVQIILQEEFGMLQPIDPAGGSWAVETLTKQMKEKIWKAFQDVEAQGGILPALRQGEPQAAITAILESRFKNSELRRDRIVGNNMYPNMTEKRLDPRPEDEAAIRKDRTAEVQEYLSDIDTEHKDKCLDDLQQASVDDRVEKAIAAASAGATLTELAASSKAGQPETVAPITAHRWSERFEKLRRRTEDYKEAHQDNVKIFLANMGPIPQHKARADFTTGFLQVGAFEVLGNDGFKTPEEAAKAAAESHADAVVICSTDATYPEIVPQLAPLLHKALPEARVFLAGAAPKDLLETYKEAGIDDYISVRANCYNILLSLQKKKGMME
ncbi:methylmalonyl-CoA mutase family protein [Mitsuokella jalaludinii]|uniref:methylmalonyl-CoA mutase family protein n=1 Tax=Mitsuokella jalaludinii TaxID=187979 RepID=UPI0029E43FD3|nr:methylmalonyl-CoA mutase family protein [Selenomonadaceae bacterium]